MRLATINTHLYLSKDLEKRCGKSEQYSRRECLEIAGIPKSVDHKDLEKQVLDIFGSIDVNVKSDDVEACHRIGDKGRTIIKLSKRKNVQSIFANKKKLKNINPTAFGLPNAKVYINESLCGMYRGLWYKCKLLHQRNCISRFWTSNGSHKIIIKEHGNIRTILHDDDLQEIFPNVDITNLNN